MQADSETQPRSGEPNAFDAALARSVVDQADRDRAVAFAGRHAELARFDAALRQLDGLAPTAATPPAVFRVFQGPPGCGKSSLLRHLEATARGGCLFVQLNQEDLASRAKIEARIAAVAAETAAAGSGAIAGRVAEAVGAFFRAGEVAAHVVESALLKQARRFKVVLWHDEAQMLRDKNIDGLASLHTNGLRVPTVCLLAGLPHTEAVLTRAFGSARLADNAVVRMGGMRRDECIDSTRSLLDRLRARGERGAAARRVAAMAHDWPQHLFLAQRELCSALLITRGDLHGVPFERVEAETALRRNEYYAKRLAGAVIGRRPTLTRAIVDEMAQVRMADREDLTLVCQQHIRAFARRGELTRAFDAEAYADALLERGVLAETEAGFEVAIPSMATWLHERWPDGPTD